MAPKTRYQCQQTQCASRALGTNVLMGVKTMTIYTVVIAKTGDSYSYDTATLPKPSIEHATDYGFRQSLNDACASVVWKNYKDLVGLTDAERKAKMVADARALVAKRDQQYRSGNVPGSRVVINPKSVLAAQSGLTEEEMDAALAYAKAKKEKESKTTLKSVPKG